MNSLKGLYRFIGDVEKRGESLIQLGQRNGGENDIKDSRKIQQSIAV